MSKIYHIGLAVPDLQQGMQQLGALFDLTWRRSSASQRP